ncbi:MAG: DNA translocase FtsK 4TM domain-containing protein, partial [Candidatus Zixiibacteriota bacterium]
MAKTKSKLSSAKRIRVFGIILMLLALLMLVSLATTDQTDISRITGELDSHLSPFDIRFHNQAGMVGAYLAFILFTIMGWLAFFIPLGLALTSIRLFAPNAAQSVRLNGLWLFIIALSATTIYNVNQLATLSINIDSGTAGGYLVEKLGSLSLSILGESGSYLLLSGVILILLVWHTPLSFLLPTKWQLPNLSLLKSAAGGFSKLLLNILTLAWLRPAVNKVMSLRSRKYAAEKFASDESELESIELESRESEQIDLLDAPGAEKRELHNTKLIRPAEQLQLKTLNYTYPTLDLLDESDNSAGAVSNEELSATADLLKETLESFGITIEGDIARFPGPIITRYEFKPGTGIK